MNQTVVLAIGVLLTLVVVLIVVDQYSKYKLRQQVKRQWGRMPKWHRLDHEESLVNAWKFTKTYKRFDSEVDDITWHDLDMFEVFEAVNATYSSIGSEALYQRMRNFDLSDTAEQQLEELISFYEEQPETREAIQFQFARLGKKDNNFVAHYLATTKDKELKGFGFFVFMGCIPLVGLILLGINPIIAVIVLLSSICFNTIYYLRKKEMLQTELESMRYCIRSLSTAKDISKIFTPVQQELKEHLNPLKGILKFGLSFRVKSNSEADVILDYVNMIFMLPFISYHFVLSRLAKQNKHAIALWNILGRLEVAYAVLNFRLYMEETCVPGFKSGGIEAEASYHPLLKSAAVKNPVAWTRNTLVTGSNASGKSTYVKSIAINAILSQVIHTAAAVSFSMERGHVLTSMAVEDDIFEGDSYFVAEIKSIKRVLNQAEKGQHCYCFIDEILKGTNTIERISASASIINWLKEYPALAFVATHDIELTEILKHSCENVHFEEQVEEEGITFDYKLRQGAAKTRNALQLLRVMDYPMKIVKQAQAEAAFFDTHRSWQVIE